MAAPSGVTDATGGRRFDPTEKAPRDRGAFSYKTIILIEYLYLGLSFRIVFGVVDGFFEVVDGSLNFLLQAAHSDDSNDVCHTGHDDGETDEGREHFGGDVKVLEAQEAEDGTDDTQQQDSPPVGEAQLLVVEALDGCIDTLDDDEESEQHRQRHSCGEEVEQEEAAEEDFKQCNQNTGGAVRQEGLRSEGEHHLKDAREQRQQADYPSCGQKRDVRSNDADDTECNEQEARNAEPDFFTCFHDLMILVNDEVSFKSVFCLELSQSYVIMYYVGSIFF